jgi:hypothetical protein
LLRLRKRLLRWKLRLLLLRWKLRLLLTVLLPLLTVLRLLLLKLRPSNFWRRNEKPAFGPVFLCL